MRTVYAYEFRTLLEAQRRRLVARQNDASGEVSDVDAALARLENGSYGMCIECQGDIERAALKADPLIERCASCRRRDGEA
jgi:DnaK suppressor protein